MSADDLAAWDDYGTWSGVLDLIRAASWCAADRDDDPVAAADRLRTLGRMLDHAATIVREDEADRRGSRRCACACACDYRLDDYGAGEVTCGACVDVCREAVSA